MAATLDDKLDALLSDGFVVVPRELVGISSDECARVHAAQLREIDKRFPGWRASQAPVHTKMTKALAGGFLGVQLLPEQLEMEFDPRIKKLFVRVFSRLLGKQYTSEVWTWLERSNVSFAQPLRDSIGQNGALPHIDDNPWSDALDRDAPYDIARWEPKVRQAGLHDVRPMEKDRPVQAFVALTDCAGGANGGGMGLCRDRELHAWLKTTPPHGRNGHWGKLTRIYPKPGGKRLKALAQAEREAIERRHVSALAAIEYPAYRAGDIVLWLRETLHAGPQDNRSGVHGARLYLGALPDNRLNRDAMRRQWEKLQAGLQAHGRSCDRAESTGDLDIILTQQQRLRAGAALAQPMGPHLERMPADSDLFAIPDSTVALGFKNATAIVHLKSQIDNLPLEIGARVFVKLGESTPDLLFAAACAALRRALGMESPPVCVVWIRPTIDWAALAARVKPSWGDGVHRRLTKALAASAHAGSLPAFVSGAFSGEMASAVPAAVREATGGGLELLRVLLFRKFVGCADTNGRNILVQQVPSEEAGAYCVRILSVDETAADVSQLARGLRKGLQTAQSFHADLIYAAYKALTEQPAAVAEMIRALLALDLPDVVTAGGRLRDVHLACPFDDASLAILDSGRKDALHSLASRLALVKQRKRKR